MAQHGSGYGGPPGYPPGGGAPPGYPPGGGGGHPPGGGGYPPGGGGGYPPGQGSPPQGGPPGYGGPPQGAPPGYPGAPGFPPGGYGPPPPAKKSNALLWVGIGCGVLLLLSIVGAVAAYFMAKSAAEAGLSALSAAAAPGSAPADGVKDSAGSPLGGACAKAADCCRKFVQKSNAGAQAEAGCLAFKQLPETSCEQPLQTYQQSARLLGVSCD